VHTIEDTPENILAAKMKYKVKYLKTWIKFEKSEESIETRNFLRKEKRSRESIRRW